MDALLSALLLGLSVDGLVLCPFFAFGVTLTDRRAGLSFLLGRLVGITCFGIAITLIGSAIHLSRRGVNLAFGGIVIAFGLYRLAASVRPEPKGLRPAKSKAGPLHGGARCGRSGGGTVGQVGFGLGLFRGLLNPGRKYVYLPPLLVGTTPLHGTILSLVFGIGSSVYLALAFCSAGLVARLLPRRRIFETVSAVVLMGLGGLYLAKATGSLF